MMGLLSTVMGLGLAQELRIGSVAPDFSAPSSDGGQARLKDVIGKAPVVLYFYPKDSGAGCTKEICSLRDNFSAFRKLKATVFGISGDSQTTHQAFAKSAGLPFLLLADTGHRIAKLYGADDALGDTRTAFVIDLNGKIVYRKSSEDLAHQSAELEEAVNRFSKDAL